MANHPPVRYSRAAVLSVNYRGSRGYAKAFLNAGDRQWCRKMHDDLVDAVARAVEDGIADPNRIAIVGNSYGGYAALAALALQSELFCCGAPLNLETLVKYASKHASTSSEGLYHEEGR